MKLQQLGFYGIISFIYIHREQSEQIQDDQFNETEENETTNENQFNEEQQIQFISNFQSSCEQHSNANQNEKNSSSYEQLNTANINESEEDDEQGDFQITDQITECGSQYELQTKDIEQQYLEIMRQQAQEQQIQSQSELDYQQQHTSTQSVEKYQNEQMYEGDVSGLDQMDMDSMFEYVMEETLSLHDKCYSAYF